MENLSKRFPDVVEMILNNLDVPTLATSMEASRELAEFLDTEKLFWLRSTLEIFTNFHMKNPGNKSST